MALRAVQNTSLADKVFEQLAREILNGSYQVAAAIPSERALSEIFAVNRHVVREAIKRLEQVGLVRVSQGGATRVLDFRRTAGLDLLAVLAEHTDALGSVGELMLSCLQMRAAIGADVARLCAERCCQAAGDQLIATAERLPEAVRSGPAELFAVDQLFWEQIVAGAENLAYQLAFNSLIRAIHSIPDITAPLLEAELKASDFRRPIAEAIAAGDGRLAELRTREALEPAGSLLGDLAAEPISQPQVQVLAR